jgi:hypothetical protein
MFGKDLPLDDEVDGRAHIDVQHEQLLSCDLSGQWVTESRSEIILDLRYSRKRAGSNIRYSLPIITIA